MYISPTSPGKKDTFWVFVGTNMLCLWVAMILPETKARPSGGPTQKELRDF